jgi:hypothetical protein
MSQAADNLYDLFNEIQTLEEKLPIIISLFYHFSSPVEELSSSFFA